jgi:hypothetical protein
MLTANGTAARRRRLLGAASCAVLIASRSSGCLGAATPTECTTVGYRQHVDFIVDGPTADEVGRLVLCTERGCSVPRTVATPARPRGPWYSANDLGDGPGALT